MALLPRLGGCTRWCLLARALFAARLRELGIFPELWLPRGALASQGLRISGPIGLIGLFRAAAIGVGGHGCRSGIVAEALLAAVAGSGLIVVRHPAVGSRAAGPIVVTHWCYRIPVAAAGALQAFAVIVFIWR